MTLSTYSLVSLEELKDDLRVSDSGKDLVLQNIANTASDLIEQYLNRNIVSRGTLTEYHTMEVDDLPIRANVLSLLETPVISVTSVHECLTWPRVYDSTTLLVSGTDYQVNSPSGRVYRLASPGVRYLWGIGFRAIRVVYTAGYATTAAVPSRIKGVTKRLCAVMWEEFKREIRGVSSMSDQIGNFTRFSVATLTPDMKADLAADNLGRSFQTGERDA